MEPDRYATVLVSVTIAPRDLAIAREQHWFRIPVKSLPTRAVNSPVLAFYQTSAFGDQKWSINYWAFTTAWDTVPRIELLPLESAHPRANELYYKIRLGDLRVLPHPIVSRRWKRVTFIVTHWGRFETAYELNELLHGSIWEERLWRALRKMGRLAEQDELDDW